MKVLLISILRNSHRNLSVLSLYATLKRNGTQTSVLFLPVESEYDSQILKEWLKGQQFRLVGISLMTDGFNFANKLTNDIKESLPNSHVIYGGIHPTLRPEECLEYADTVCIGEGEKLLPELVSRLSISRKVYDIEGIGTKQEGIISLNRVAPQEKELDKIPFINYDWDNFYVQDKGGLRPFKLEDYARYSNYNGQDYTIMASRSCPFHCTYCCNTYLQGIYGNHSIMRRRSVKNVIGELKYALGNHEGTLKFINFMDEQFMTSTKWVSEFAATYKRDINLPFIVQANPDTITENNVSTLREAGMTKVIVGIQSGSKRTNEFIYCRHFDKDVILGCSQIFKKHGVFPYYDIILQNKLETDKDRDETLGLLLKLKKPFALTFYGLTLFPETEIAMIYLAHGQTSDLDPYKQSYKDFDENDVYYRLYYIVPKTWNWFVWLMWQSWRVFKIRYFIDMRYKMVKK